MSVHFLSQADAENGPPETGSSRLERGEAAAKIAATHAEAVDGAGRFPIETLEALKTLRLLGAQVPVELGGEGASLREIAEVGFTLAESCASSAMVFAMHQIALACLIRHAATSPWHRDFLARAAKDQLLLASSTTEGGRGGDIRVSAAALRTEANAASLERDASVMSYGEEADAVATTARRSEEAAPTDQVLVVFERGQYGLERTKSWSTLGMRGTRSGGFAFRAAGAAAQVVPTPYAEIHALTMTPVAHILWSAVWLGAASAAVESARQAARAGLRASGEEPPFGLPAFLAANGALQKLRSLLTDALKRFEAAAGDPAVLGGLDFQTSIVLLKVEASELAVEAGMHALRCCGLAGYRTDGPFSVERQVRDLLSAPLMISNDRIRANVGLSALFNRTPQRLFSGDPS